MDGQILYNNNNQDLRNEWSKQNKKYFSNAKKYSSKFNTKILGSFCANTLTKLTPHTYSAPTIYTHLASYSACNPSDRQEKENTPISSFLQVLQSDCIFLHKTAIA